MRITNNMQNQSLVNSVNTNQATIALLQQQLASGKKVNSASDNPSATPGIMDSITTLNKIDIYQNNITYLNSETEVTDGILGEVSNCIQRLRELTINAANGTNGVDQLKMINDEVKQIKEQLVSLANSQYQNTYIFSGNRSTTPAYTLADDGSIVYNGTPSSENYKREYSIADGMSISTNLAGDSVFGYSNLVSTDPPVYEGKGIMQTVNALSFLLEADPAEYDEIRSRIADLDESVNEVTAARTYVGGAQNRLKMTEEQHETNKITYEALRANLQDIDISQVVSDLSTQQVALQASLYASSQMMNISLLNYL